MRVTYTPGARARKRGAKPVRGDERVLLALAAKHPTLNETQRATIRRLAELFKE